MPDNEEELRAVREAARLAREAEAARVRAEAEARNEAARVQAEQEAIELAAVREATRLAREEATRKAREEVEVEAEEVVVVPEVEEEPPEIIPTPPLITPESVATPDMRPDEILVAMSDAGADTATLIDYINANPTSVRGAEAYRLSQELGIRIEEFTQLTGKERIDTARALGILPEGFDTLPQGMKDAYAVSDEAFNEAVNEYNAGIEADRTALEATHTQVPGGWVSNEELARLKEEDYEAYTTLLSGGGFIGLEALTKQRAEVTAQEVATFESTHTKLPGLDAEGNEQWIDNNQLNDYKNNYPELYGALMAGGIKAAQVIIDRQQAQIAEQQAAQAKLKDYVVETKYPWEGQRMPEMGYDLPKYFQDQVSKVRISAEPVDKLEIIHNAEQQLLKAGFSKEVIQQARLAAFTSPIAKIEPVTKEEFEEGKPGWLETKITNVEMWQTDLLADLARSAEQAPSTAARVPISTGAGLMQIGIGVATGLPLLVGKMIVAPMKAPALVYDAGKGMVTHVVNTATNLVTGAYGLDLATGNASRLVYDTGMSYLIVKGGVKLTKAVVSKVTTYIAPRGVPLSVIAKELSTGRITDVKGMTKAIADAMNEVEKLAATKKGALVGEVIIKGTPYKIRYIKTPIQQTVGNILWHGTKDEVSATGQVIKTSALTIAQQKGGIVAGSGGIYTSPWAAVAYTRGGQTPGLLMVITDASKIKVGTPGFVKGMTQADSFIRGADKGFYGSSKGWRGDFETEVVGAPGTKIVTPPPTIGLYGRLLAGNYADFFTYDAGKYIPIKIGIDAALLKAGTVKVPTVAQMYAAKLLTSVTALRSTVEALKHPSLILKDIAGTAKAIADLDRLVRSGGAGGGITLPGVRNAYLITDWGTKLKMLATDIYNQAFKKTQAIAKAQGIKVDSAAFKSLLERNMQSVYESNASALLGAYMPVVNAYSTDPSVRTKFEASYIANLGLAIESLVKSNEVELSSASGIYSDAKASLVSGYSVISPTSLISSADTSKISEAVVSVPSLARTEDRVTEDRVAESPISLISEIISARTPITTPVTTPITTPITTPVTTVSSIATTPVTPVTPVTTPVTPIREIERPPYERPPIERPIERPPIERPIERPPEERPPKEPPPIEPTVITVITEGEEGGAEARQSNGAIAWRQGLYWKYIPPPYKQDKPITMPRGIVPKGAKLGGRTPAQTIQMIGRSEATVPESISVDLGIVDAFITAGGTQITFAGKGLSTDVGERMSSPTMGMSVDEGYPGMLLSNKGINRASMRHKKPVHKKKARRDDDFGSILEVRGRL